MKRTMANSKKIVVGTILLASVSTFSQAQWFFRGTANSWAATEMTQLTNDTVETCQVFNSGDGNGGPRFKIDQFGDWSQSYPSTDQTASANSSVEIIFNTNTLTATSQVVSNCGETGPSKNFSSLYFRGTANSWTATEMVLIEDFTWQLNVNFDGQINQRFKLDVNADWSENYGDTDLNGTLEQSGDDITTSVVGEYVLTVNDQSQTYSLEPSGPVLGIEIDSLGAVYSQNATTFSIWSPDNSDVTLSLDGVEYAMEKTYDQNGYTDIYAVEIEGDLHLKPYYFNVNNIRVRDPYGKMTMWEENTNIVMDMSETELTEGWASLPTLVEREDAIIYEVHIRDFTIDETSGVSQDNRGKYLGMVEHGTSYQSASTGIDHLLELGVTHVQLLPFYDFASCPELTDTTCYNWGYDPRSYNVPEERYSVSQDYEQRVRELKTMINEFHKAGIRVIMDVVYNHTDDRDMFEPISNKYYTDFDLSGCCGNAVDANVPMVGRMIQDSLEYWVEEYNLDGFRFDLVGIFDHDEFGQWGRHLNETFPDRNLLIYGEPWAGVLDDQDVRIDERVRLGTIAREYDAHLGVFNDQFRNALKGNNDDGYGGGFVFNQSDLIWKVDFGSRGSLRYNNDPFEFIDRWDPLFATDPEQSINYVSAHDNLTLRDKIIEWADLNNVSHSSSYLPRIQKYANGIILTSQGLPFIHAGSELLRTKQGVHNSYKSSDDINKIRWNLKVENSDVFAYYQDLISLRKNHSGFRMNSWEEINNNITTTRYADDILVTDINAAANGDSWSRILIIYASGGNFTYLLPSGNWKVAVEKADATQGNNRIVSSSVDIEGTAVTVLYQD